MIEPGDPLFLPMFLLLCVMLTLLVPAAWISVRLGKQLRVEHPGVWEELGEPGWPNLTITSSSRAAKFIRTGGYKRLGDPVLNRCVGALKIVNLVYLACLLGFFGLFLGRAIGG